VGSFQKGEASTERLASLPLPALESIFSSTKVIITTENDLMHALVRDRFEISSNSDHLDLISIFQIKLIKDGQHASDGDRQIRAEKLLGHIRIGYLTRSYITSVFLPVVAKWEQDAIVSTSTILLEFPILKKFDPRFRSRCSFLRILPLDPQARTVCHLMAPPLREIS